MKKQLLALAIALSTSSAWAGGLAGLGLGSSSGSGADSGFYAGFGAGKSTGDQADACDANDWKCYNWKAYGGYQVNQTFGVEGNYYNLLDEEAADGASTKSTAYSVAATAGMPVMEGARVFGKVGMYSSTTDKETIDTKTSEKITTSTDDKGTLFGVGASYKFTSNLGVRGEYEHFKGDETSSGIVSGGLTFSTF